VSLKILVIEDNDDNREMMAIILKFQGFTIVTAVDGRQGLNLAEAEHPDLIITDLNMPYLDGIERIKLLREHQILRTIQILALTAYGPDEAAKAIKAGADQAMTKPTDFDSMMKGIRDLIGSGD
jgi:CheY-like chemotaxis protein